MNVYFLFLQFLAQFVLYISGRFIIIKFIFVYKIVHLLGRESWPYKLLLKSENYVNCKKIK